MDLEEQTKKTKLVHKSYYSYYSSSTLMILFTKKDMESCSQIHTKYSPRCKDSWDLILWFVEEGKGGMIFLTLAESWRGRRRRMLASLVSWFCDKNESEIDIC